MTDIDEQQAFDAGRCAFRDGLPRDACPFPGPFQPPRTAEDAEPDVRAGLTIGAFWLDGYEQQRDRQVVVMGCIYAPHRVRIDPAARRLARKVNYA
jgi:hypothetical protein